MSLFYPGYKSKHNYSKAVRRITVWCPVCDGAGKRKDAKTLLDRDCVACHATGFVIKKV